MKEENEIEEVQTSRREVIKKAGYATPAILTLAMTPSFAAAGSATTGGGHGGGRRWRRRQGRRGWWRRVNGRWRRRWW